MTGQTLVYFNFFAGIQVTINCSRLAHNAHASIMIFILIVLTWGPAWLGKVKFQISHNACSIKVEYFFFPQPGVFFR